MIGTMRWESKRQMIQKRLLKSARYKCFEHLKGEWCGHLTPSEIFALIAAGVIVDEDQSLDYIKVKKDTGRSNPSWFYFYPNGVMDKN